MTKAQQSSYQSAQVSKYARTCSRGTGGHRGGVADVWRVLWGPETPGRGPPSYTTAWMRYITLILPVIEFYILYYFIVECCYFCYKTVRLGGYFFNETVILYFRSFILIAYRWFWCIFYLVVPTVICTEREVLLSCQFWLDFYK